MCSSVGGSAVLYTNGLGVQLLGRAHAWSVGYVVMGGA